MPRRRPTTRPYDAMDVDDGIDVRPMDIDPLAGSKRKEMDEPGAEESLAKRSRRTSRRTEGPANSGIKRPRSQADKSDKSVAASLTEVTPPAKRQRHRSGRSASPDLSGAKHPRPDDVDESAAASLAEVTPPAKLQRRRSGRAAGPALSGAKRLPTDDAVFGAKRPQSDDVDESAAASLAEVTPPANRQRRRSGHAAGPALSGANRPQSDDVGESVAASLAEVIPPTNRQRRRSGQAAGPALSGAKRPQTDGAISGAKHPQSDNVDEFAAASLAEVTPPAKRQRRRSGHAAGPAHSGAKRPHQDKSDEPAVELPPAKRHCAARVRRSARTNKTSPRSADKSSPVPTINVSGFEKKSSTTLAMPKARIGKAHCRDTAGIAKTNGDESRENNCGKLVDARRAASAGAVGKSCRRFLCAVEKDSRTEKTRTPTSGGRRGTRSAAPAGAAGESQIPCATPGRLWWVFLILSAASLIAVRMFASRPWCIILPIFVAIQKLVMGSGVATSGSMYPTIQVGDQVAVDRVTTRLRPLYRNEVVAFHRPENYKALWPAKADGPMVKRIVAVENDLVEVKGGKLFVNGKKQEEPWVAEDPEYRFHRALVPKGHVFVLGDNRNHSDDGYIWGFLPTENIIGRVAFVFWPPHRAGSSGMY